MRIPRRTTRRSVAVVLTTAALSAGLLVAGLPAASTGAPTAARDVNRATKIVSSGQAWGSQVSALDVVNSGRTGYSTICTTMVERRVANNVADTAPTLEGAVDVGVVTSSQELGKNDAGQRQTVSQSAVETTSLLGGVIQIGAVTSRSVVTKTANGYTTEVDGDVASISVGGQELPLEELDSGAPGEIPLGPLGTIYFNESEERASGAEGFARLTVLRVDLPTVGAEVELGVSVARMQSNRPGAFRGGAWSTDVAVLGLANSGKTGYQPLPCAGTDGKTRQNDNNTAGITVPGAVDIGATESVARTFKRKNGDLVAVTRNELAGVDLGGQLDIEAITAQVVTVRKPSGKITSTPTWKILGVTAGGEAQELPVPGDRYEIPGLGHLTVGDTQKFKNGARVTALTLVVLEGENELKVRIGNAQARILR